MKIQSCGLFRRYEKAKIVEDQLKLAEFGQSVLLPMSIDMNTVCENDFTAQICILHLGWISYAIAVWDLLASTSRSSVFRPVGHPAICDQVIVQSRVVLIVKGAVVVCWVIVGHQSILNVEAVVKWCSWRRVM
jgi:hypothetical protein